MSNEYCPHCRSPITAENLLASDGLSCAACEGLPPQRLEGTTIDLLDSGDEHDELWDAIIDVTARNIGRFEIDRKVGQGGFGTVFKARDIELGRTVAIKIPRFGQLSDPQEIERFLREARHAARLRHDAIVPVLDVGWTDDVPYIVTDYIDGKTLDKVIAEKPLSFDHSVRIVIALADALEYAHRQGVVHRDIKPSNIMLDNDGHVNLMDFGLARDQKDATLTQDGQILGTPAYMSPEQASGDVNSSDERSDVYSLGVILYELLTRERPFRGNQRMLLHHVLHDPPRQPRSLNDSIPVDLDTICQKTLEKDPARRYQSAGEFAADLRRWVNHEPIQARRIGLGGRLLRWYLRNTVVARFLAGIFLIIGAAAGIALALLIVAQQRLVENETRQAQTSVVNARLDAPILTTDALPWLIRALELDADKPQREWASRVRIANTLRHAPELMLIKQQPHGLSGACFTSDGQFAVTVGDGRQAQIWDVAAGAAAGEPLVHPTSLVNCALSPDDRYLVCGGDDGHAYVWSLADRRLLARLDCTAGNQSVGPWRLVKHMWFCPFGKRTLLLTGTRQTLQVWEFDDLLQTGAEQPSHPVAEAQLDTEIDSMRFSQEGHGVLIADKKGDVYSWPWEPGDEPVPVITQDNIGMAPAIAAFSLHTDVVAVGQSNGSLWRWHATELNNPRIMAHVDGGIRSVDVSPDGLTIAVVNRNSELAIFRLDRAGPPAPYRFPDFGSARSAFTHDSAFLARLQQGSLPIMLFDLPRHRPFLQFGPEIGRRYLIKIATDKANSGHIFVLMASTDGTFAIWRVPTNPTLVNTIEMSLPRSIIASPTSSQIAMLHLRRRHAVTLCDTRSPDLNRRVLPTHVGDLRHGNANITAFAFGDNDRRAATGDSSGEIIVWDISGDFRALRKVNLASDVSILRIHPTHPLLLAVNKSRSYPHRAVWNYATGEMVWETPPPNADGDTPRSRTAADAHFVGASQTVAYIDGNHAVLSTLQPPESPRVLKHSWPVTHLQVDPTGETVLVATEEPRLHLWDVATQQQICQSDKLPNEVTHLATHPETKHCAIAFKKQSVQRWSTEDLKPTSPATRFAGELRCLDLSADGEAILFSTTSQSGAMHLVHGATGEPLAPVIHGNLLGDRNVLSFLSRDGEAWAMTPATTGREAPIELHRVPVTPDSRDLDELKRLVKIISGREVDSNQSLSSIPVGTLQRLWTQENLRSVQRLAPDKGGPADD